MAFFAAHETDIFLHTWREGDPAELDAVVEAYAPRRWRIEERPLFLEEKRRMAERFPARPPLSTFDMFHSVAGSLELVSESGEAYDMVVRARFDALFDGVWTGDAPAEGRVVVPDLYPEPAGCTDQFAAGRPAAMQAYAGAGAWLPSGVDSYCPGSWLRPEQLLRRYLEAICGLVVDLRPIAMKLLRDDQLGRRFADVTDDPLFHAAKHEDWEAFAREQLPDLAGRLNFNHVGRMALNLDRALGAWLDARPQKDAFQLLKAPWSRRIHAIDAFVREQAGEFDRLDEAAYTSVRMVCAMLLQRMDPKEPMTLESFVVHVLSANAHDMQRAADWAAASEHLAGLADLVARLGPLRQAIAFANPLEQKPVGAWRSR